MEESVDSRTRSQQGSPSVTTDSFYQVSHARPDVLACQLQESNGCVARLPGGCHCPVTMCVLSSSSGAGLSLLPTDLCHLHAASELEHTMMQGTDVGLRSGRFTRDQASDALRRTTSSAAQAAYPDAGGEAFSPAGFEVQRFSGIQNAEPEAGDSCCYWCAAHLCFPGCR